MGRRAFLVGQWVFRIAFLITTSFATGVLIVSITKFHSLDAALCSGFTALLSFGMLIAVDQARIGDE